ncbi:MAG: hypothetical protein EXS33_01960 [Pedosphaera sp.]|nr:hypothetical protein [Pedosphaera sp.]
MPDVFTKAKRSEVMSRIRSRGNQATELALAKLLRRHGLTGWRRQVQVRIAERGSQPPSGQRGIHSALCTPRFGRAGGFRFPAIAARVVRGRLFLARLPEIRDAAEKQSGVLAEEICPQPGA